MARCFASQLEFAGPLLCTERRVVVTETDASSPLCLALDYVVAALRADQPTFWVCARQHAGVAVVQLRVVTFERRRVGDAGGGGGVGGLSSSVVQDAAQRVAWDKAHTWEASTATSARDRVLLTCAVQGLAMFRAACARGMPFACSGSCSLVARVRGGGARGLAGAARSASMFRVDEVGDAVTRIQLQCVVPDDASVPAGRSGPPPGSQLVGLLGWWCAAGVRPLRRDDVFEQASDVASALRVRVHPLGLDGALMSFLGMGVPLASAVLAQWSTVYDSKVLREAVDGEHLVCRVRVGNNDILVPSALVWVNVSPGLLDGSLAASSAAEATERGGRADAAAKPAAQRRARARVRSAQGLPIPARGMSPVAAAQRVVGVDAGAAGASPVAADSASAALPGSRRAVRRDAGDGRPPDDGDVIVQNAVPPVLVWGQNEVQGAQSFLMNAYRSTNTALSMADAWSAWGTDSGAGSTAARGTATADGGGANGARPGQPAVADGATPAARTRSAGDVSAPESERTRRRVVVSGEAVVAAAALAAAAATRSDQGYGVLVNAVSAFSLCWNAVQLARGSTSVASLGAAGTPAGAASGGRQPSWGPTGAPPDFFLLFAAYAPRIDSDAKLWADECTSQCSAFVIEHALDVIAPSSAQLRDWPVAPTAVLPATPMLLRLRAEDAGSVSTLASFPPTAALFWDKIPAAPVGGDRGVNLAVCLPSVQQSGGRSAVDEPLSAWIAGLRFAFNALGMGTVTEDVHRVACSSPLLYAQQCAQVMLGNQQRGLLHENARGCTLVLNPFHGLADSDMLRLVGEALPGDVRAAATARLYCLGLASLASWSPALMRSHALRLGSDTTLMAVDTRRFLDKQFTLALCHVSAGDSVPLVVFDHFLSRRAVLRIPSALSATGLTLLNSCSSAAQRMQIAGPSVLVVGVVGQALAAHHLVAECARIVDARQSTACATYEWIVLCTLQPGPRTQAASVTMFRLARDTFLLSHRNFGLLVSASTHATPAADASTGGAATSRQLPKGGAALTQATPAGATGIADDVQHAAMHLLNGFATQALLDTGRLWRWLAAGMPVT